LSNRTAVNQISKKAEYIKKATMQWIGWPCKDMSVLNVSRQAYLESVAEPLEKAGISTTVFWDVIRFMEAQKPIIVVLENVAGLFYISFQLNLASVSADKFHSVVVTSTSACMFKFTSLTSRVAFTLAFTIAFTIAFTFAFTIAFTVAFTFP
jgi:hypothetical protein